MDKCTRLFYTGWPCLPPLPQLVWTPYLVLCWTAECLNPVMREKEMWILHRYGILMYSCFYAIHFHLTSACLIHSWGYFLGRTITLHRESCCKKQHLFLWGSNSRQTRNLKIKHQIANISSTTLSNEICIFVYSEILPWRKCFFQHHSYNKSENPFKPC